jgi:hypothetical protein
MNWQISGMERNIKDTGLRNGGMSLELKFCIITLAE